MSDDDSGNQDHFEQDDRLRNLVEINEEILSTQKRHFRLVKISLLSIAIIGFSVVIALLGIMIAIERHPVLLSPVGVVDSPRN